MKQYLDALQYILDNGENVSDRTGVGTRTVFGYQMRFPLTYSNFPAVTTKKLAWRSVVGELLWFLEGSTSEPRLAEITHGDKTKNTIWTANFKEQGVALGYTDGELGPVYGSQWRNFNGDGVDQIASVIDQLKNNPDSRRIIVSAWNPSKLDKMALPPCHAFAQFKVINGKLSCQLYQRSADMFLGVPFNIASYGMLLELIAKECNMIPGELIGNLGDVHLYSNHIKQAKTQISREPYQLPVLTKLENVDILNGEFDYTIEYYESWPKIEAPLSN